jgi:hypothetical protein
MPQDNTVLLEDVRIIFRNFAGKEGMYNREGDRNFAVVLPQDVAEDMKKNGWNVKVLKARDEDETDTPYISVSVNFKGRPPTIKMISSRGATDIDEGTVELLDYVDIAQVDLIIRPYDWAVSGNTGRKAYLQSLYITIIEDPLALKYDSMEIATVEGPMMERTETLKVLSTRADEMKELER